MPVEKTGLATLNCGSQNLVIRITRIRVDVNHVPGEKYRKRDLGISHHVSPHEGVHTSSICQFSSTSLLLPSFCCVSFFHLIPLLRRFHILLYLYHQVEGGSIRCPHQLLSFIIHRRLCGRCSRIRGIVRDSTFQSWPMPFGMICRHVQWHPRKTRPTCRLYLYSSSIQLKKKHFGTYRLRIQPHLCRE